jgi:hypothetical protein
MQVIELSGSENITIIRQLLEAASLQQPGEAAAAQESGEAASLQQLGETAPQRSEEAAAVQPLEESPSPQPMDQSASRHPLGETAAASRHPVGETEVLLYVPKGCEALERNRVNLAVLRRWADNLNLRLGVVFEDRETRGLAREVGLLVLHSIEQGQKANLSVLDRRRRRHQGLPPRPISSILPTRATRSTAGKHGRASRRRVFATLLVAVLLFAALGLGLLLVLPSASVTLRPTYEPVEASMEIVGVAGLTEVNYGSGQIPARTASVEREGTDKIATTGRIDVPDGYAQGAVVFANKTTIPVTITKGTVVRTSTGDNVRFYTVADAWLPGELYGTVRVGVLAAEAGPRGNVPAFSINVIDGELAAQADVLNDARTSGGTVRRMGTVDGQDKVNLRARLMKQLQEEAYGELTAALAQSEFIPPDSLVITILSEAFDHNTGDMAEELALTMQVQVSGLAVDTAGGETLLLGLLEQRMKPGYRLVPNSATFTRGNLLQATPEEAHFTMSVRAAAAPAIDAEGVREAIAGQTVPAATEYLSQQYALQSEPRIELSNSFVQRLPWWAARIRVQVVAD